MDAFFDEVLLRCDHPGIAPVDDRTVICNRCGRNLADAPLPNPVGVAPPLCDCEALEAAHVRTATCPAWCDAPESPA